MDRIAVPVYILVADQVPKKDEELYFSRNLSLHLQFPGIVDACLPSSLYYVYVDV